jgi:hypothetical protein
MPGRSRTRRFYKFHGTGGNTDDSVPLGGDMIVAQRQTCNDVTGAGDNNTFDTYNYWYEGALINRPRSQFGNHFENYVADIHLYEGSWTHFHPPGLLSNIAYATQLAARTNPSRPYVDIPVNLAELGDIVKLIRNRGRGIITDAYELTRTNRRVRHVRNTARTNLLYQFGIAPLVSDMAKLTQFRREFLNRKKEIERLAGPRGLRRTVALGSGAHGGDDRRDFQTNLARITNVRRTWLTTENVKGHIR